MPLYINIWCKNATNDTILKSIVKSQSCGTPPHSSSRTSNFVPCYANMFVTSGWNAPVQYIVLTDVQYARLKLYHIWHVIDKCQTHSVLFTLACSQRSDPLGCHFRKKNLIFSVLNADFKSTLLQCTLLWRLSVQSKGSKMKSKSFRERCWYTQSKYNIESYIEFEGCSQD